MLSKRSKCQGCKHYSLKYCYPTCEAFPEGIPVMVFNGRIDHEKPYKGDNGIRYEPVHEVLDELFNTDH